MLYFKTNELAAAFADKRESYQVVDCTEAPSINGLQWAVKVL